MGVVACVFNPRTWEGEAEGSGIQTHSWLHKKLETSLGYMRRYPGCQGDPSG